VCWLQGKNLEIERSVEDLISVIQAHDIDPHIEPLGVDQMVKLRSHYNHFMYQALLNCSKNSLNSLKKRVASREVSDLFCLEVCSCSPGCVYDRVRL
jgi:dynein heavy chain